MNISSSYTMLHLNHNLYHEITNTFFQKLRGLNFAQSAFWPRFQDAKFKDFVQLEGWGVAWCGAAAGCSWWPTAISSQLQLDILSASMAGTCQRSPRSSEWDFHPALGEFWSDTYVGPARPVAGWLRFAIEPARFVSTSSLVVTQLT